MKHRDTGLATHALHLIDHIPKGSSRLVTLAARSLCLKWLTRFSYRLAEEFQLLVFGVRIYARQALHDLASTTAEHLQSRDQEFYQKASSEEIQVLESPPLYDAAQSECNSLLDGILVKVQKSSRAPGSTRKRKRFEVGCAMIPTPEGSYITMCQTPKGEIAKAMKAHLHDQWKEQKEPINVITLTDGARNLNKAREEAFGEQSTQLLDWYHLELKVHRLNSMLSYRSQKEKRAHKLSKWLWRGRASTASKYLESLDEAEVKNVKKRNELVTYLRKHEHEIPDYLARQSAGKLIGSGRMEEMVDRLVGQRGKDQGMSWTPKGVLSIARLSVADANEDWESVERCLAA